MSSSTDERGRIYLPKDVRDRFGDRFRIVELPGHVALFPVDEEPIDGVTAAVGDAFEGTDAADLKAAIRKGIDEAVDDEKPATDTDVR